MMEVLLLHHLQILFGPLATYHMIVEGKGEREGGYIARCRSEIDAYSFSYLKPFLHINIRKGNHLPHSAFFERHIRWMNRHEEKKKMKESYC